MSVSKVSIRKKAITNGRESLYLEFSPSILDMKTMASCVQGTPSHIPISKA